MFLSFTQESKKYLRENPAHVQSNRVAQKMENVLGESFNILLMVFFGGPTTDRPFFFFGQIMHPYM